MTRESPGTDSTEEQRLRGMTSQLLLYARDLKRMIEEERRRAEELAAANDRLLRVDKLKSDFLSFVSHELRTPLTSMGMIKLLDDADADEKTKRIVELVHAGYRRLDRFVERSLDYFSTLASDDDWTATTANLSAVLRDRLETLDGRARVEVGPLPDRCAVRGHSEPLAQVLDILFDNAIKHTDGEPFLEVRLQGTDDTVRLSIRDEGKGFPAEMASEIVRAGTPADIMHHSEGTALSLALAVQLVERCGGKLSANSEGPGKGSIFTIELLPRDCEPTAV